ncbi:hypothetical protein PspLS_07434 [Pyricularia sp. CBS 133598]|nr:hypothetical protein PspLS_07434 [Pyricularia sp. CBS 133598]
MNSLSASMSTARHRRCSILAPEASAPPYTYGVFTLYHLLVGSCIIPS